MSTLNALTGYPLTVWNSTLAAMEYGEAQLPTFTGAGGLGLVRALGQTFRNARDALDASVLGSYAARAYLIISPILAMPLGLSPSTLTYVQARMLALQAYAIGTSAIQPAVAASASAALLAGNPSVADPFLLEYLVGFSAETIPFGLTTNNFADMAEGMAEAWDEFAAAALAQLPLTSSFGAGEIAAMALACHAVADELVNTTVGDAADLTVAWNGMAAVPAISRMATRDSSDPTSQTAQQLFIARLVLCDMTVAAYTTMNNMLLFIPPAVNTITVLAGDTLMSIAARGLGDYTQWQALAALNGLRPPYISAVPGIGLAAVGSQIYLPTSTASAGQNAITYAGQQSASQYEQTFLGIDLFYGPINQEMLPFTGDLQTIVGYQNLAFSLGRRLQTALQTLIYHQDFGSRIPYEIGSVQLGAGGSQPLVGALEAYGQSAILGDTRVDRVIGVSATVTDNQLVTVAFSVLPKGATTPVASQDQPDILGLRSGAAIGGVTGSG